MAVPSAPNRYRWDEFLPLRGVWARRLLLALGALGLWIGWGIQLDLPGGNYLLTGWEYDPTGRRSSLGPQASYGSVVQAPNHRWGRLREIRYRGGSYVYSLYWFSPLTHLDERRTRFPQP